MEVDYKTRHRVIATSALYTKEKLEDSIQKSVVTHHILTSVQFPDHNLDVENHIEKHYAVSKSYSVLQKNLEDTNEI